MKVFRFFVFAPLLICTFFMAVYLRDEWYDRWLQYNIETLQNGMTEEEVISQIGRPSTTYIGDIGPGIYWCYRSRSFEDNPDYCGYELEMSAPPRKLVKVLK
jgi:hypothetical protein